MVDFLKSLLIAEDHTAPYIWAAVALAHAMIGAGLMIAAGLIAASLLNDALAGLVLVASAYGLWEVAQTAAGGPILDAVLDWLCVMLGAVLAAALWSRHIREAAAATAVLFSTVFLGVMQRLRRRR